MSNEIQIDPLIPIPEVQATQKPTTDDVIASGRLVSAVHSCVADKDGSDSSSAPEAAVTQVSEPTSVVEINSRRDVASPVIVQSLPITPISIARSFFERMTPWNSSHRPVEKVDPAKLRDIIHDN